MNLEDELAARLQGVVVVVGLGNPLRGDDAAGSVIACRIAPAPDLHVINALDVPENYLAPIASHRPDTIVLIDSMDMNCTPGSVALLNSDQISRYSATTHRVPMSVLIGVLRRETHALIFALGIQPADTGFLQPVSDTVIAAAEHLAVILNRAIRKRPHVPEVVH